ncbi:energy-coupling factor transporter ATPase [Sporosarcina sp. FSL W8-0480]|uniref:ABC transporter ATP-binding protein n=1 Tax=Sporosarcina sp. FSL W8-0480 TaxID=2954701 RepID=UPI0030DCDC7B
MEIISMKNLSFRFPGVQTKTVNDLNLHINEGEFVVLCGPSGCGKTTLLRLLKKELAPVGQVSGEISYKEKDLNEYDGRTLIEEIGLVFQDPDNQIVMDEVMQEIVFGLENLGYSNFEMKKRVAEMVHFFGVEDLLRSKPSELSGGQKQLLNLLSVLLLKPKVLLLDEPTSQLDPIAAKDLIVMLERLNKEMGITIILVEHRLEELFSVADRILMMEAGEIVHEGSSQEVIDELYRSEDERFLPYIPSVARLYMEMEMVPKVEAIPLNVKDSKRWFESLPKMAGRNSELEIAPPTGQPLLVVKECYFQYEKKGRMVLKNLSLHINKGEFFALVGGNGSGKTTALRACIGSVKPQRGKVYFSGKEVSKLKGKELFERIAYLPQNPKIYFVHDTIGKEMQAAAERNGIADGKEKVIEMLTVFGIEHLLDRHPYDCSGGEIQKAALACMLIGKPDMLFIDEPTKGLDPVSKERFSELLLKLHSEGLTIMMVTHDIEFAAQNAERCAMMFDGEVTVTGSPRQLFMGNYFYTTALNRATRGSNVLEVLTYEEALANWSNHRSI